MERISSRKPVTESRARTLSQTMAEDDDESPPHSPLHSPSDARSSPSPVHTLSSTHSPLHTPSPENPLSKAIVPVDYSYPVVKGSPGPHAPSPPLAVPASTREAPAPPSANGVRKARVRRSRRWGGGGGAGVDRAALGLRVAEMVLCLVSFSVMAADRTEGWSGDSFDRYKEYRYCLSITVIAFAYAGLQACSQSYHLITGKNVIKHHLRHHFEFAIDQILAYLLISASSSSATRVDDWQSNWGKDEFTIMATASVTTAFLAFSAFAISSLISGYNLCGRHPS
uniref:CASP-like protein n=1 Tax=Kalanchoe fedtschenkoi TaxID=63787 RepID=A0A7N0TZQ2_KALFE